MNIFNLLTPKVLDIVQHFTLEWQMNLYVNLNQGSWLVSVAKMYVSQFYHSHCTNKVFFCTNKVCLAPFEVIWAHRWVWKALPKQEYIICNMYRVFNVLTVASIGTKLCEVTNKDILDLEWVFVILNIFEINYSQLIQYEILEKLVTLICCPIPI